MQQLNIAQLVKYMQLSKSSIQRRARKQGWQYTETVGLGGKRRLYHFETLPLDVKNKIIAMVTTNHSALNLNLSRTIGTEFSTQSKNELYIDIKQHGSHWYSQHTFIQELDDTELNKPFVSRGLLALAHLYNQKHNIGKIAGFDQFSKLYTNRQLPINPKVYSVVSKVSRITLIRWEKKHADKTLINQTADVNQELSLLNPQVISLIKEYLNIMPDISAKQLKAYLTLISNRYCNIPNERILSHLLKQLKATL